jgi:hypothetical protein
MTGIASLNENGANPLLEELGPLGISSDSSFRGQQPKTDHETCTKCPMGAHARKYSKDSHSIYPEFPLRLEGHLLGRW